MSNRKDKSLIRLVTIQDIEPYLLGSRIRRTMDWYVTSPHRFVGAHPFGLLLLARRW